MRHNSRRERRPGALTYVATFERKVDAETVARADAASTYTAPAELVAAFSLNVHPVTVSVPPSPTYAAPPLYAVLPAKTHDASAAVPPAYTASAPPEPLLGRPLVSVSEVSASVPAGNALLHRLPPMGECDAKCDA